MIILLHRPNCPGQVAADPCDATNQRFLAFRLAGGTPTLPITPALLLSMDAGKGWSEIASIPTAHPEELIWDPSITDRVYLTGDAGEVYRSNDAGAHWTRLTVYTDFLNVSRTD